MQQEELKKIVENFFAFFFRDSEEMDVVIDETENSIKILLYHPYGESLTGKNEDLLKACELILSRAISKDTSKRVYLDVNNYKKNKEEKLKEIIKKIAKQCSYKKESFTFPPMNAYQRRLVHMEIANHPDLITESVGEEPERKVVIKPLKSENE